MLGDGLGAASSPASVACYALLFRDFLRANEDHGDTWGRLKLRLARERLGNDVYGQWNATGQPILMSLAER